MTDEKKQDEQPEAAPVERPAVTGRPNDIAPGSQVRNTTFAQRAAAARKLEAKAVQAEDGAENKAVQKASTKRKK